MVHLTTISKYNLFIYIYDSKNLDNLPVPFFPRLLKVDENKQYFAAHIVQTFTAILSSIVTPAIQASQLLRSNYP